MKHRFFLPPLLFFMLFNSSLALGQLWFSDDAEWVFGFFGGSGQGYERIQVNGDTLVDGRLCRVLSRSAAAVDYHTNFQDTSYFDLDPYFVYEEQDSVFYYIDGEFRLMYDFSLSPNEIMFLSGTALNGGPCASPILLVVMDTGSVQIQNEQRRFQKVQAFTFHTFEELGKFLLIEGVGMAGRFYTGSNGQETINPEAYFLLDTYFNCFSDGLGWRLRCYSEGLFSYNPYDEDCFALPLPVGLHSARAGQANLFPNPASTAIFLDMPAFIQLQRVEIVDLSGSVVQRTVGPANRIEISGLPVGVYFARLYTSEGLIVKKVAKGW